MCCNENMFNICLRFISKTYFTVNKSNRKKNNVYILKYFDVNLSLVIKIYKSNRKKSNVYISKYLYFNLSV